MTIKTVQVITATGTARLYRVCKGCRRNIELGELCLRYKKAGHSNYHCRQCAKRYNPAGWEQAIRWYYDKESDLPNQL